MPIGAAGIIAGGAALGNLFGKSSAKQAQQANAWLPAQTAGAAAYVPLIKNAQKIADRPYPSLPTIRAVDPATDPFASRALFQLQQQRDNEARMGANTPQAPAQNAPAASALDTLRQEMMAMQSPSNQKGGGMGFTPTTVNALGLKKYYTLTPQQQSAVQAAHLNGALNADTFSGQYGFDPFSY